MYRNHPKDGCVYMESEAALILALNQCLPGSTLVIDGHWVHNSEVRHDVWDP